MANKHVRHSSVHFLKEQECPWLPTDSRDAEAQRMLNIPYRIIW